MRYFLIGITTIIIVVLGIVGYKINQNNKFEQPHTMPLSPVMAYSCLNFEENTARLSVDEEKTWQLFQQKIKASESKQSHQPYTGTFISIFQKDDKKVNEKLYQARKNLIVNSLPKLKEVNELKFPAEKSTCDVVIVAYTGVTNDTLDLANQLCYPDKYVYRSSLQCSAKYQCRCTNNLIGYKDINDYHSSLFRSF